MSYQKTSLRFLIIVSILLLLWYGQLIRSNGSPKRNNHTLRGYARIGSGRNLINRQKKFLDMHCSQCALVSSSGQMMGAGLGAEIDQIGCVIRMNNAPTRGYEQDVGNRTSVRVVSHTSVPHLLKQQRYYFEVLADTTYVVWGPERNMRQDGKGQIFNILLMFARKYPHVKIYAVTKEKIDYCDLVFQNETGKNRMKTGAYLSTGFFTMILAMEMCDSIHVYGMIDDQYCSRANHSMVPYHYYERKPSDECKMYHFHERTRRGGHRFITEKSIYAKWATRHQIDFSHPSWET